MACTTVYGYETTAETDQYQAIVDELPPLDLEEDFVRGNPEAPITIFEYADFQCPACVGFAQYTEVLIEYFPETIRVVFRHLPLPSIHDKAFISGMAGEAAGAQGMFWEMHDFLYESQREWSGFGEEEFVDWIITQAGSMGMDTEQFESDLLDEEVRQDLEDLTAERLNKGMNYTPFVVINDRIFRNNQPDIFGLIGIYEFDGYEECPSWVIDPEKSYTAVLDTSAGEIEIELFSDVAPLAVNSFVFLAQEGWYDGVYFHRVVEDFVAQAGDPSGLGAVNPGYTFANETTSGLSFDSAGVLGMANAGPDTNGSQFFITLAPTTDLDGGYTIFGEVKEGSLSVLDEIALRDPNTAVGFEGATIINSIEIIEE
jgi:cyclophilin family peptidyl-prolyl cis-trans isomerase/protein-disulfide isomerase